MTLADLCDIQVVNFSVSLMTRRLPAANNKFRGQMSEFSMPNQPQVIIALELGIN